MVKYTDDEIIEQAKNVVERVMGDLKCEQFTVRDVARGMKVEYEHGTEIPLTNVTNDDPMMTGKIALAHLLETRGGKRQIDYYDGLAVLESASSGYWRHIDAPSYWMHKRIGVVMVAIILLISLYKVWTDWQDNMSPADNPFTVVLGVSAYLLASWK